MISFYFNQKLKAHGIRGGNKPGASYEPKRSMRYFYGRYKMDTIKINFNTSQDLGKLDERITIACSKDFKGFVERISSIWACTISAACHRYILEGIRKDLGAIFGAEPHLDKSLKDVLKKYGKGGD